MHITLRAALAPLRSPHVYPTVRLALASANRRDPKRFRILHFSVQGDHVHLLVEAANASALASGVRGVSIRIARYVNELLSRRGPLWADRWHARALTSPREVRNALVYVLANFRKHAERPQPRGIDPYSSAAWFDGWLGWSPGARRTPPIAVRGAAPWLKRDLAPGLGADESKASAKHAPRERAIPPGDDMCPVLPPETWLARTGWRRHGLIGLAEAPQRKPGAAKASSAYP